MRTLPRWGIGIVGDDRPEGMLTIGLGSTLISKAELFSRNVQFTGDHRAKLLGLGGVWTASKYRGRGFASSLMVQARQLAVMDHYNGTVLFSLENTVPFYESLGYTRHTGAAFMKQPNQDKFLVPAHVAVMTLLIADWVDPSDPITVEGLPW